MDKSKLAERQISNKIESLRLFKNYSQGIPSWVEYVRKAYRMTVRQLASKAGVSKSTISQIERGEKNGQVTVRSLKMAAEAMNCDFIYAIIPRNRLEDTIQIQARFKAKQIIEQSHIHMELEDQAVDQDNLNQQILELAQQLESKRGLWDE